LIAVPQKMQLIAVITRLVKEVLDRKMHVAECEWDIQPTGDCGLQYAGIMVGLRIVMLPG
jgi:hypothetical protein